MSRTAMAMPASTNARRTAGCSKPGASPAPIPASSTSSTTSPPTPTDGSMSPTAKTTACRCSTATAKYEAQWNNLHRPCALHCCGGKHPQFIIGELGPGMAVNRKVPNLGPRLTIVDSKGQRIARLGGEHGPGLESGKFLAPHGIALDSKGDIYVGEVGVTDWKTSFPDTEMPEEVKVGRCLQKLAKG